MTNRFSPYALAAAALLLGVLIGRVTTAGSHAGREENDWPARTGARGSAGRAPRDRPASLTASQRLHDKIRRASPQQIPKLVYRILEISDPSDRKMALYEAIRAADPEQCQAIMDQFYMVTRETGRSYGELWDSALFETGKIGGTEILDSWVARGRHGDHKELRESLYGLASQDPQSAMAWLNREENAALPNRERLVGYVIAGTALTNMPEAARMMKELPPAQRRECIGHFMWSAIQNEGIDRAIDWALTEKSQTADFDAGYAEALENDVFERIFSAAEWTGGAPLMAERIAHIDSISQVSGDRIVNAAQRLHGGDGLVLLDRLAKENVISADDAEITVRAVKQIVGRSPEVARQWLQNNQDSPLRQLLENGTNP